jgi:hypothetical protein
LQRQAGDLFKRAPALKNLEWIATDDLSAAPLDVQSDSGPTLETLAFLQYT